MQAKAILQTLALGDRRTTGTADKIATVIADDSKLFDKVFGLIISKDKGLAMRAADAVEKASRKNSNLLKPHRAKLIKLAQTVNQQEVQWHVAQMLERLELNKVEQEETYNTLRNMYEKTASRIVKASALQAMVHIATGNPKLEQQALKLLNKASASSVPSLQARVKKLVKELEKQK